MITANHQYEISVLLISVPWSYQPLGQNIFSTDSLVSSILFFQIFPLFFFFSPRTLRPVYILPVALGEKSYILRLVASEVSAIHYVRI